MIRLVTMALGGDAWLGFMGNEFGHPEWIDFPRDGNNWSYLHCRRQWNLTDDTALLYNKLNEWEAGMHALDNRYKFVSDSHLIVSDQDDETKVSTLATGSDLCCNLISRGRSGLGSYCDPTRRALSTVRCGCSFSAAPAAAELVQSPRRSSRLRARFALQYSSRSALF